MNVSNSKEKLFLFAIIIYSFVYYWFLRGNNKTMNRSNNIIKMIITLEWKSSLI